MGRPRNGHRTVVALYRGDRFIEVGEKDYILRKYAIAYNWYIKRRAPYFFNNVLPNMPRDVYEKTLIIVAWEEDINDMPDVHEDQRKEVRSRYHGRV